MRLLNRIVCLSTIAASSTGLFAANIVTLSGTVRDFLFTGTTSGSYVGHPDFQCCGGAETGIVTPTLGVDGKPVYAHGDNPTATVHGQTGFNQWYNNTPNINQSVTHSIDLTETSPGSGIYEYSSSAFFPIDDQLLGNQSQVHNYGFTYELHTTFTYQAGQSFNFTGDDDVWVYINNQLVIDLGGVHGAQSASVNLDTLSLTVGNTYNLDFFFAERHTSESNLRINTSIPLISTDPGNGVPDGGSLVSLLGLGTLALAALKRRL